MSPNDDLRLRRLEIWNRVLALALLSTLAVVLLGGTGDEAPSRLACSRLDVLDDEGRVVAWIGVDAEGSRGLFILDREGRPRATVTHDDAQSALFLWDEAGTVRLGAAQFAHGGGGFALHGPEAKGAAVLYHKEGGSLTFYDPEGAATLRLPERDR